jgi:hypothetical protein
MSRYKGWFLRYTKVQSTLAHSDTLYQGCSDREHHIHHTMTSLLAVHIANLTNKITSLFIGNLIEI